MNNPKIETELQNMYFDGKNLGEYIKENYISKNKVLDLLEKLAKYEATCDIACCEDEECKHCDDNTFHTLYSMVYENLV